MRADIGKLFAAHAGTGTVETHLKTIVVRIDVRSESSARASLPGNRVPLKLCFRYVSIAEQGCTMLNNRPGSIQVLARADALLEAVARGRRPMSLTELSREVGLNKSTALNILATLVDLGFLSVTDEQRRYRLGARLLELGTAFESSIEIVEVARPALVEMRDASGETASLHIRSGWERLCVAQVTSLHQIRRVVELGRLRPLYSGSAGFVLLSGLPEDELNAYLDRTNIVSFTPNTITDKEQILAAVREARTNEYAAVFEDTEPGASAVAVPIRERSGRANAAFVLSGPSSRFDIKAIENAVPVMQACAAEVSRQLGWSAASKTSTIAV